MTPETLATLNATIARLTHMTHGQIGCDWRSGRTYVIWDKGDTFGALLEAMETLRLVRGEMTDVPLLPPPMAGDS